MPLKPEGRLTRVENPNTHQKFEYQLYPISVLAESLSKALNSNRTVQTLRKWEVQGVLPQSIFRYGSKRMYHKAQIELICKLAVENNVRQGSAASLSVFSAAVFKELKKLNASLLNGTYSEPKESVSSDKTKKTHKIKRKKMN